MDTVQDIVVRPVLGFRGRETIEVNLIDSAARVASCRIPFGTSEGAYEAVYCSPQEAVVRAREVLLPIIKGSALANQIDFDAKMIACDGTAQKQVIGGNLMLGASMAYARLSSMAMGLPLYSYIARQAGSEDGYYPPRLLCNIVEGGAHADNDLEFQEHLIIPSAGSVRESIGLIKQYAEAFFTELKVMKKVMVFGDEGGWAGAFDTEESMVRLLQTVKALRGVEVEFGFDIAANNILSFEPKAYLKRYIDFAKEYPLIYIEDPFPEQNHEPFYQELYRAVADRLHIVGDDLVVTNPEKIKHFTGMNAINGIIIKPDQVGTLSETIASARLARDNKWIIAVAHRAQETTDDYLADLAIGLRADFVKFGYLYQGERLAKYNRLLEIEDSFA